MLDLAQLNDMEGTVGGSLDRQSALVNLAAKAIRSDDLGEVLADAAGLATRGVAADGAMILELQPGSSELLVRSGAGWASNLVGSVAFGAASPAGQALATGQPVTILDIDREDRFEVPHLLRGRAKSAVYVPIGTSDKPFGVLTIDTEEPRSYEQDDVQFLSGLAEIVTAAVERRAADEARLRLAERHAGEAAASQMRLRELQHRIKNNLQVITSLINLQSRRSASPEVSLELDTLGNRIEALRLVHEKLYSSSPQGRIYLAGYVRDLCANLVEFCGGVLAAPVFDLDEAADIATGPDIAIPFGLLINEFIGQCVKSVLKGGRVMVAIRMRPAAPPRVELLLSASQSGSAVVIDGGGFGRQLIEMMASQLDGALSWPSPGQAEIIFSA